MKIVRCRTNHLENPLGYAFTHITVTWQVEEALSKHQEAARIQVSETEDMKKIIYDTGKDEKLSSLGVMLPVHLKPRTRYYWQVTVWGDADERAISDVNWFETGKMEEHWEAEWITPGSWEGKNHPYLRKHFHIAQKVKNARAYVCGLGGYELYMNGQKAGKEYLAPGCTTYDEWVQCYTYDITALLSIGDNVVGALIGNGWAKGRFGTFPMVNRPYVDQFLFLAEIHIEFEDGKRAIVCTDDTWRCHESEISDSSIYDGESSDLRKTVENWCTCLVNNEQWDTVRAIVPKNIKKIEDRFSPAIVIKEYREPIEIIHTPAGETVLDMGQNMTGWMRFRMKEPAGTKITLSYGEILQEGNFYNENLRTAKALYTCISDGNAREIEPHFTFYGFRYVKVEGISGGINSKDFTGCVVYSDLEETGCIETTDPLVNRLFLNAKWGQKSNFLDVPTDCPQRDERMGWTGDTQVFAGAASFNMETYAFYRKFLHDLWHDQKKKNGMVGNVIPCFIPEVREISMPYYGGAAVWGDCATILPWKMYLQYGDKSILEEQYESMRSWVDWITERIEKAGEKGLWTGDHQWGDWLALDGPVKDGTAGGTDETYIATAYYKCSADIVSKTANILGMKDDQEKYKKLAEKAKASVFEEYFSKNGRSTITTQTAYLLALKFDLVPEHLKERVLMDLVELLHKDNLHLKTGFVGTPFLCRVLSEYGYGDVAYKIFMQEDCPGWLYAVKMGATTIWERWDSVLPDGKISSTGMNSLNHYSYGSIIEWMYRHMCGIQPLEDTPGYTRFELRPEPDCNLYGAKAVYQSPKGRIEIGWERDDEESMHMKVVVPFDTEAILYLPSADVGQVLGLPEKELSQQESSVCVTLDAGTYELEYPLTRKYRKVYSLNYPLEILKANPETKAILYDCFPMLDMIPDELMQNDASFLSILNGVIRMSGMMDVDALIEQANERLAEVPLPVRRTGFSIH